MFMLPAYDATAFAMLGFGILAAGFGPWILIGFCLLLLVLNRSQTAKSGP